MPLKSNKVKRNQHEIQTFPSVSLPPLFQLGFLQSNLVKEHTSVIETEKDFILLNSKVYDQLTTMPRKIPCHQSSMTWIMRANRQWHVLLHGYRTAEHNSICISIGRLFLQFRKYVILISPCLDTMWDWIAIRYAKGRVASSIIIWLNQWSRIILVHTHKSNEKTQRHILKNQSSNQYNIPRPCGTIEIGVVLHSVIHPKSPAPRGGVYSTRREQTKILMKQYVALTMQIPFLTTH